MAKAAVKDTDHGAKALLRDAAKKMPTLIVGVIGDKAASKYENEVTVADVAAWNEFGTSDIPERSFLRAYVDIHRAEIEGMLTRAAQRHISGERDIETSLDLIGQNIVGGIQERISEGIPPENAQVTIDRKGSSKPLIDTGQLRASITHKVEVS